MELKTEFAGAGHAGGRLNNSLVRFKGEPVMVDEVVERNGKLVIDSTDLAGNNHRAPLTDYNLTPVPLGNVMVGDSFMYISRIPERRWRLGLTKGSISYAQMPWERKEIHILSEGVKRCINNKYVTFNRALEKLAEGFKAVPFSRNFGIGKKGDTIVLTHRGQEVGEVAEDVYLNRKFFYLQEALVLDINQGL